MHLADKTKSIDNRLIINAFYSVGMTGFEPATSRPPDVYSNRTELHPEFLCVQKYTLFLNLQIISDKKVIFYLASHGFPIEVKNLKDFLLVGRLVDTDVTDFSH